MADEPKDSYERMLKQFETGRFPVISVESRGNLDNYARTAAERNCSLQAFDSPELDISLAMQESGPDAAKQRFLDNLLTKLFKQAKARIQPSFAPHDLTPSSQFAATEDTLEGALFCAFAAHIAGVFEK